MAAYRALYRKYRPVRFDDVIGQDAITAILRNEVSGGKIAHAYLFTGSHGTGKTSCSKILAKAVNCPNQSEGNPCGVCETCTGIDNGSVTDVLEIDAASNNGVDNIRDLRAEANFTPSMVRYRVYIIDEAHMLSIGASNALLKIMEEPPEYVIFILATTEVHKIPATILSRCQRFDFKRIDPARIAALLHSVAEKESIKLTEDAAELIARLADGGVRDALSLLDLCAGAAYGAKEEDSSEPAVTAEVVARSAGQTGRQYLSELAGAVLNGNVAAAFSVLHSVYQNSVDTGRLCDQMIHYFRDLMIVKTTERAEEFIVCLPDELERLKQQAQSAELEKIFLWLRILQETQARLARAQAKKTEMEMALVRLCTARDDSAESLAVRVGELERAVQTMKTSGVRMAPPVPTASAEPIAPPGLNEEPSAQELMATQPMATQPMATQPTTVQQIEEPTEPLEPEIWARILESLGKTNPALGAALRQSAAYRRGDLLLIESGDELFVRLIRDNDYAKESLREAVRLETGTRFRLGPYKREKPQEPKENPLDAIEQLAAQAGIEIIQNTKTE